MHKALLAVALLLTPVSPGCGKSTGGLSVNGAGASLPYPLYLRWMAEYAKLRPELRLNYQSIGSGGGLKQITERTVDFGASDTPMSDELLARAPGRLVHIPTTIGAVALTYNLPGVAALRLSPERVAGVFLGEIRRWSDERLKADNPGVSLPDEPISVVHRSDGSGTTAIFTEYLSGASPVWRERVGTGTSVNWPVGPGGKGNEAVTSHVKNTPGALGYLELAYAVQSQLPAASLKNREGAFVAPTLESMAAAASGAAMPPDLRVSIVDAPGAASYPLSAFSYVLVYEDAADTAKGEAIAKFLWWATHEGQAFAAPLSYAPLPAPVVARVEGKLRELKGGGKPLLAGRLASPWPRRSTRGSTATAPAGCCGWGARSTRAIWCSARPRRSRRSARWRRSAR